MEFRKKKKKCTWTKDEHYEKLSGEFGSDFDLITSPDIVIKYHKPCYLHNTHDQNTTCTNGSKKQDNAGGSKDPEKHIYKH